MHWVVHCGEWLVLDWPGSWSYYRPLRHLEILQPVVRLTPVGIRSEQRISGIY